MRRIGIYIALIVIYLSAALALIGFFSGGFLHDVTALLSLWVSVIIGFALILGLINVLNVHFKRVAAGGQPVVYSIVLLISAFGVIGAGIYGEVSQSGGGSTAITDWIFRYVYQPLTITIFSLLAFLLISAAIRTLRIKTVESTLLLLGALIVLLGQVQILPFNSLTTLSQWFQTYPVLGAIRGVLIGAALGAIATSLRYLLGVDNDYLR